MWVLYVGLRVGDGEVCGCIFFYSGHILIFCYGCFPINLYMFSRLIILNKDSY